MRLAFAFPSSCVLVLYLPNFCGKPPFDHREWERELKLLCLSDKSCFVWRWRVLLMPVRLSGLLLLLTQYDMMANFGGQLVCFLCVHSDTAAVLNCCRRRQIRHVCCGRWYYYRCCCRWWWWWWSRITVCPFRRSTRERLLLLLPICHLSGC